MNILNSIFVCTLTVLFLFQNAFSQTNAEHPKAVEALFNAMNNGNINEASKYFSAELKASGYSQPVASKILDALSKKLGSAKNYKLKSQNKKPEKTIEYIYTVDYTNVGIKDAMIVVDSKGKILELELVEAEIKVLDKEDTSRKHKAQSKLDKHQLTPFGNLMLINAYINGVKQNFLLDTGAAQTILNQKYLDTKAQESISTMKGINNSIDDMDITTIESFVLGSIKLKSQKFLTLDLTHLEKDNKLPIHGILGYDVLKHYDLIIDYPKRQLQLIKPEFFDNIISKSQKNASDKVSFKMQKHLPVFSTTISNKPYLFTLDSGASANLIHTKTFDSNNIMLSSLETTEIKGASKNKSKSKKGSLSKMLIGKTLLLNSPTVIHDIKHLEQKEMQFDGILGHPFLRSNLLRFVIKQTNYGYCQKI